MQYPVIEYQRWFSNVYVANDPDDAFEVSVSNDAGATWVPLETVGPLGPGTEGGWIRAAHPLPAVHGRATAADGVPGTAGVAAWASN